MLVSGQTETRFTQSKAAKGTYSSDDFSNTTLSDFAGMATISRGSRRVLETFAGIKGASCSQRIAKVLGSSHAHREHR